MENRFYINKTNNNLIVEIRAKPKFYAYLLLLVIVFALVLPFIFLDTKKIDTDIIFFYIVYAVLMILFPVKYALWNVFGKEILMINRKSISYQYNFGFISNNLKTISYTNLVIDFGENLIDKKITSGKVYFYEEDEKTDLPRLIHNTSIFISQNQYNLLMGKISELHSINFSLN